MDAIETRPSPPTPATGGPMPRTTITTAAEFKAARQSLGLSISELGSILNVNPDTIRNRWERKGGIGPNPVASRVLEWMLSGTWPRQFDGGWDW